MLGLKSWKLNLIPRKLEELDVKQPSIGSDWKFFFLIYNCVIIFITLSLYFTSSLYMFFIHSFSQIIVYQIYYLIWTFEFLSCISFFLFLDGDKFETRKRTLSLLLYCRYNKTLSPLQMSSERTKRNETKSKLISQIKAIEIIKI